MRDDADDAVLLLGDDPLIAAFMAKALRKGSVVEGFDRGLAALERATTRPAGLLLLADRSRQPYDVAPPSLRAYGKRPTTP